MDPLEAFLQGFCQNDDAPKITGKLDESNKYVIRLPQELHEKFEELFAGLDDESRQAELNMISYNVRISNLEEVFN